MTGADNPRRVHSIPVVPLLALQNTLPSQPSSRIPALPPGMIQIWKGSEAARSCAHLLSGSTHRPQSGRCQIWHRGCSWAAGRPCCWHAHCSAFAAWWCLFPGRTHTPHGLTSHSSAMLREVSQHSHRLRDSLTGAEHLGSE